MSLQTEFFDDRRIQRGAVREGRTAEAGRQFAGTSAAAEPRGLLQDERFQAGFRQNGRGDQSVVAASNNQDFARHDLPALLLLLPRFLRMVLAYPRLIPFLVSFHSVPDLAFSNVRRPQ